MKAVVTTEWRGVFCGEVVRHDEDKRVVELRGVRNCLYWHQSVGGVFGLAKVGPNQHCRIGAKYAEDEPQKLYGVTSVTPCADAAIEAWESAPCVS